MQISNVAVYGIFPAIVGVRNSYKSVDKSDSSQLMYKDFSSGYSYNHAEIGEADMKLLKVLSKRNDEYGEAERKFLRQIFVGMDITAPRYWWQEYSTYKIGTTENSESTLHIILRRELTKDDFEDNIDEDIILYLNDIIKKWKITYSNDLKMEYFRSIKNLLPEGYLQKRYCSLNYEVLRKMYKQRKNHKLNEWKQFCEVIETLPYAKEFIIGE